MRGQYSVQQPGTLVETLHLKLTVMSLYEQSLCCGCQSTRGLISLGLEPPLLSSVYCNHARVITSVDTNDIFDTTSTATVHAATPDTSPHDRFGSFNQGQFSVHSQHLATQLTLLHPSGMLL